jgi:hypothetical protein
MLRAAALALTATMLITPAFAGPTETAFLGKLVGTWTGKGQLTGQETGPIACKLVFKQGSGGKVSYSGRCNVQDVGAQSFSGTLSYNDRKKVYEGKSMGGTAQGVKKGSSIVFASKSSTLAGRATSSMTVSVSRIVIDFVIVEKDGDKTTSHVTFGK